jgi:DHA1 family bicyclomycin/chloramphenicol resistance-like MFS transporter
MNSRFLGLAIVLGLLSAIGPFAIDMYLPAMPSIGGDLGASPAGVQMSLLAFFISMGVGQLAAGPISDIYGRKGPLYVGMLLFMVGSVGAALSPTVEWLVAFRFLQGLGATAGLVVPRAIVRDLYTGNEAAKLMSLLMLVFSVSPILAPLTGSLISESFGWRGVFWAVTLAAAVAVILIATSLKETRPAEHRAQSNVGESLKAYGFLLRNAKFLGLAAIGSFAIASFFVYLANSSFLLIEHYGLTPRVYSLFFSINAASFFAMSQLTGRLAERFGLDRVVRYAVTGYAGVMVLLLVLMASGIDSLGVLATLLFFGYGFVGLVIPSTSVLAMDDHGEIAGTASALLGTLQLGIGAIAMGVSGAFANGTPLPMVTGIAICAVLSFTLAHVTLARIRKPATMVDVPAE